jgi:hypothetical protein
VITAIPIGDLVNNADQETPAANTQQGPTGPYQAQFGADRERDDADSIVRVVDARNLCRAAPADQDDQVEIDVDGA